jgi:hypothetical protein
MKPKWPGRDLFAVTSDGTVFVNALVFDDVDLVELVRKKGVFVGVRLRSRERRLLVARMNEAGSEAAAFISGGRHRRAWRR